MYPGFESVGQSRSLLVLYAEAPAPRMLVGTILFFVRYSTHVQGLPSERTERSRICALNNRSL